MSQSYTDKPVVNEREYPNIVEVAVGSGPLHVELNRRMMLFSQVTRYRATTWPDN
jgi:hypothetical protein